MSEASGPEDWIAWAQRLRAIAQTGLAYADGEFDLERYREIDDVARGMLAAITGAPPARLADVYQLERGYPTPKVDVRAGVFRAEEVLLVREASDGRWSLPGGWADEHETPSQNVEREVLEESGYRVRAVKLAAVKDRNVHPYVPRRLERIYKLLFVCELTGGSPTVSIETTDARFFALDALPELSLGRTLPEDVDALARHHREPSSPVTFD